jgi:two-component system, NtrC family, response regulator AtoC
MTDGAEEVGDFSTVAARKSPMVRVLIVDDEPLIRWSLSETLMDRGFDVIETGDGAGAVHVLTEPWRSIDVVLLDYRLPDANDLTFLATVRRLAPNARVILMTAYGTPEVVSGALDLGAFRVLHKPFEMDDLASLVLEAHASRPS